MVIFRVKRLLDYFFKLKVLQLGLGILFGALLMINLASFMVISAILIVSAASFSWFKLKDLVFFVLGLFMMLVRIGVIGGGGDQARYGVVLEDFIDDTVMAVCRVSHEVEKKDGYQKVVVEVKSINHRDDWYGEQGNSSKNSASQDLGRANGQSKGKIIIFTSLYPPVFEGDIIEIYGKLEEINDFEDGDFSYRQYMYDRGISAMMFWPRLKKSGKKEIWWFKRLLVDVRRRIVGRVQRFFPEPHSALLAGILFGIEGNMSQNFSLALQATGTTHIIAASGYNVGLIKNLIEKLLGFVRKNFRYFLNFGLIWLYVVFLGAGIPILRAGLSASLSLLAVLLGQKAEQGVVLVLSGAILVLINPRNYSSISFQLSFLATFGMIYLVPSLESAFEFLPKWLKNSVLESLGAMIVTTPVILNSFGKISIISFVANLLVIEVLNLIMKVGIWVVLLPEKLFLIKLFASVCWIFLEYFVSVVEVLAQFKYAVIDFGDTPGYVSLVIYLSVGFFVLKFFPAQAPLTSEEKMEYLIVS